MRPSSELGLYDIAIKNGKAYDFRVKEIRFDYNLGSILKMQISRVYIKDALINVNLAGKNISDIRTYLNLGSKRSFLVDNLELSNLNLNLNSQTINAKASVSARLNLAGQSIGYLDVKIDSLYAQGLRIEGGLFNVMQGQDSGELKAKKLQFDKINIEDVTGRSRLAGDLLYLDSISALFSGGQIQGNLTSQIGKDTEYAANIKFLGLDLERLIKDLDLENKLQLSGKLSGSINLEGKGLNLNVLSGNLTSLSPGGMLIIKDDKFLKNLAQASQQSFDILVESFKNYHYNTGVMKLGLDKGNLILDIALNGEAGKRNLNITLHDFKL